LYDPFADQCSFPSGHRYCVNVYTGCGFGCRYCYVQGYGRNGPRVKDHFQKGLQRDLKDLEAYNVPPAPVHLSNSTDPFQPLEAEFGHTRFALEQLVCYRHRFTTVTVLTKNPLFASRPEYVALLQQLMDLPADHPSKLGFAEQGMPPVRVEVSLAFWRDEARAAFDPSAPSVTDRVEGIRRLRRAGILVVLRVDPLFPRSPVRGMNLSDFDVPEAQTMQDLQRLADFAAEIEAMHVVYSIAKIVRPRYVPMGQLMQNLKRAYEHLAATDRLPFRGGSWRLPDQLAKQFVTKPFVDLCLQRGLTTKYCKQNLLGTP
jgi:DNA repair photolyase